MSGEVIDLPLGTAMALTAIPDPDNETLDEQHLRINSALAAEMQQQEFQKVAEMQKTYGTSSVRFVLFCFVLFCFVWLIVFLSCTHSLPVQQVQSTSKKVKSKTCRVLKAVNPCKACRQRRKANACVRRLNYHQNEKKHSQS